jgi:hypothetical protein
LSRTADHYAQRSEWRVRALLTSMPFCSLS